MYWVMRHLHEPLPTVSSPELDRVYVIAKKIIADTVIDFAIEYCESSGRELGQNENVTMQTVLDHPEIHWCWPDLCSKRDFTVNLAIKMLAANKPLDFGLLSCNPAITLDDMLRHPELPWVWSAAGRNPSVPVSDILAHPELPWLFAEVSRNVTVRAHHVLSNMDRSWDFERLSQFVPIDDVLDNLQLPWDFTSVSMNVSVTMDIVDRYDHLPWDYYMLSHNRSITAHDFLRHPDRRWTWSALNHRRGLTMDMINSHPRRPWNYALLSCHPDISIQDILNHPDRPWRWSRVGENPNVSIGFIERNEMAWDFRLVVQNSFAHERDHLIVPYILQLRHLAAFKIQLHWRRAISNPKYALCHRVQYVNANGR